MFKCTYKNGKSEMLDDDAAKQKMKFDNCYIFVQSNPSSWLKNASTTVSVEVPEIFTNSEFVLEKDGVMYCPIPKLIV